MSILESFTDLAVSTTACLSGFSKKAYGKIYVETKRKLMPRDADFFEKRGFAVEIEATPRCNLGVLPEPVLRREWCTYEFR